MQDSVKSMHGLMQACSISIVNALEILQSCTKPSKCGSVKEGVVAIFFYFQHLINMTVGETIALYGFGLKYMSKNFPCLSLNQHNVVDSSQWVQ